MDMQRTGKRIPNALDNGERTGKKKRKQGGTTSSTPGTKTATSDSASIPRILPGEKLSEYSARVNQALPISGLSRKGKSLPGLKERQTRMEKKLQRMQNEWREEDRKIKEAEQELIDQRDEADAEDWETPVLTKSTVRKGKKGKKRKRGGGGEGADDSDDDPWAKLKELRGKPAAVHDVVQAPPTFTKVPREVFKVKGGAKVNIDNVPNAAGSLRKREELGETRRGIIESYRRLMAEKRAASG